MICRSCGREIINENSKFCIYCGAQIISDFNEGFNQTESGTPEFTGYENPQPQYEDVQPQYNNDYTQYDDARGQYNNTDTQYNNMQQAGYNLADVPREKVKKKRPWWLAFICGVLTTILSVVLFIFMLSLLFSSSLLGSGLKSMKYGELPVGTFLKEIDDSREWDDDTTLGEYIYYKIPESDRENMSEEDFEELIEESSMIEFVEDLTSDIFAVYFGQKDEARVSTKDIIELVEDNEEFIEEAMGRELKDSDYDKIERELEEIGFEEEFVITSEDVKEDMGADEDIETFWEVIRILSNPTVIFISLAVAIGVVLVLILICNLHKPRCVFNYAAVTAIISAGFGILTTKAFDMLLNELSGEERSYMGMFLGFLGNPHDRLMSNSMIFLFVGIGLIVVNIILGVVSKAVSRN
ncbi:MAG: zinc ribbon domain-containing protein [Lachnospiraceae bacterium]|nr:zinc ribbon domain-containing protein [Lachnospiraceae bacterium]